MTNPLHPDNTGPRPGHEPMITATTATDAVNPFRSTEHDGHRAIKRIRDLHFPVLSTNGNTTNGNTYCNHCFCLWPWPCPTATALDGVV